MPRSGVYIDRANTRLVVMNKSLSFLFLSALLCLCPLQAKEAVVATHVKASLNHKNISGPQRFSALPQVTGSPDYFKSCSKLGLSSLKDFKDSRWFVFNIPVVITGYGRMEGGKTEAATIIPELTFKVYLLYKPKESKGKKDGAETKDDSKAAEYRILEKEITYVDIPLERGTLKKDKEKNTDVGYAEMSVGVFIPQAVACMMMGDEDPSKVTSGNDLKIAAFAVIPSVKGKECKAVSVAGVSYGSKSKQEFGYIADKDLSRRFSSSSLNWWDDKARERYGAPSRGERLMCISETPYAPFYNGMYPATRPLYGEPTAGDDAAGKGSVDSPLNPINPLIPPTEPVITPSPVRSTPSSGSTKSPLSGTSSLD